MVGAPDANVGRTMTSYRRIRPAVVDQLERREVAKLIAELVCRCPEPSIGRAALSIFLEVSPVH